MSEKYSWSKKQAERREKRRPNGRNGLPKERKVYKIATYSKKRQAVNKLYDPLAKKFREENPKCAIKSPVCTKRTQGVNHKKGRGKYLLDVSTFEPACNACNTYCEDHPLWAIENGHKELRHTK